LDCHELQQAMDDGIVQNFLLSMWDADVPEAGIDGPRTKIDKKKDKRNPKP
jgi:hypothetical protein